MAKHGERYRTISPKIPEGSRAPKVNGREVSISQYKSSFIGAEGKELVVIDLIGDVINASENVAYPRGPNEDYRNLKWIDEHPDRFELITESE